MSDIIKYLDSYKYLRRSLEACIYLEENPFTKTSTNQMESILTELRNLFKKFFNDDIFILKQDIDSKFDTELNKNIDFIVFYIEGYESHEDDDMLIESNFILLIRQIIKSIKDVDNDFFVEYNFDSPDYIQLALSSEEFSSSLFYNSDSELFTSVIDSDDDSDSYSDDDLDESTINEDDDSEPINFDPINGDILMSRQIGC